MNAFSGVIQQIRFPDCLGKQIQNFERVLLLKLEAEPPLGAASPSNFANYKFAAPLFTPEKDHEQRPF